MATTPDEDPGPSPVDVQDLRSAFDNAPTGMAVVTPEGVVTACNRALTSLIGRPHRELVGRTLFEHTHPDDLEAAQEACSRMRTAGQEVLRHECRLLHRDGSTIWVAGFFNNNGVTASNLVYKYNTVTNTWSRGPNLPAARGAGAMAIVGRELHFWGGLTGSSYDSSAHWRLNLDNAAAGWVADTPVPQQINHQAGIALNGKIYSIGGMFDKLETTGNQSTVRVYDPATRGWSVAKSLPSARGHIGPSTFLRNGRIVIAGGSGNGTDLMREVIEYDPVTNTWAQLTPLPAARKSAVAEFMNGKIVVTGGNGPGVTSTTWVGV